MRLKGYPRIDGAPDSLYDTSALPEDWTDSEVQAQIEMREKAWRDRASQMASVREEERQVWLAVIAGKDAELANKDAEIQRLQARVAELKAMSSR